jgi:hypothetical protein
MLSRIVMSALCQKRTHAPKQKRQNFLSNPFKEIAPFRAALSAIAEPN